MLYLESHNEQNNSGNVQQAADDLAPQQTRAVDARWREVEEERRRPANKGLEQADIPLARMSSNEQRPRHRGIEGSNGQHDGRDICPSLAISNVAASWLQYTGRLMIVDVGNDGWLPLCPRLKM
jgi:hypothetical protein